LWLGLGSFLDSGDILLVEVGELVHNLAFKMENLERRALDLLPILPGLLYRKWRGN
jgi:hypothetical protein